ncbi:hypothetical protein HPB51_017037 [Rhipicephalus microplus]|uniref:Uncharacterized protein n=1 Tax=Rhipicephalus microplus TaxID=6941 RepID=A0A9J6F6B7_RHIMP|nr:hypothetical protein HPB51_017037 [Rhipicephalus microplus]
MQDPRKALRSPRSSYSRCWNAPANQERRRRRRPLRFQKTELAYRVPMTSVSRPSLCKSSECSADAYLSKYDEFLRQYQRWSEAPFLQRLYQEGERDGWPRATEAPQLGSESACDSLGSSGGSSQDTLKWHGSYSDLSAFSASNGSSLFDSGHSTLPDSGRLSPQSSCDGSLADGTQRLVSPSQAAVARSARVLQPKRHESESVLYYAPCEVQRNKSQQSSRPSECSRVAQLKAAFDPPCTMTAHSSSSRKEPPKMLFLDPEKKHRVSDPELKAIQKQAVLSFYKRQTSQDSKNSGHNTSSSGNRNRTLPRIPSSAKWSVAASEPSTSQPPSLTTTVSSVTSAMSPEAKDKPDAPWRGPRSWSVPDITQQLSVAPKAPWGPVVAATCKSLAGGVEQTFLRWGAGEPDFVGELQVVRRRATSQEATLCGCAQGLE